MDEKSQIRAPGPDRAVPIPARMTHDYVRNGMTSLLATPDLASGSAG